MSAAPRTARWYTSARRHPWVLGKVADFKIPLGPYTPAQIAVAVSGALLLIWTVAWWSWMGPVPLVAWGVAIWLVRRPKFAGRSPLPAAVGWLTLLGQPAAGRIGGRTAKDRTARALLGGFGIEELDNSTAVPGPARRPAAPPPGRPQRRAGRRTERAKSPSLRSPSRSRTRSRTSPVQGPPVRAASAVQALVAQAASRNMRGTS